MKRERLKWWDGIPKIQCQICNQFFRRITNTHLWKDHQITIEEYKHQFPNASIDAPGLADSRVDHLRGKSYEEVYGQEKASELIETRKKDSLIQMADPHQIQIRQEKCGYEISEEQKLAAREAHTIHGANNYRERALEYYGLECHRCGFTSDDPGDLAVHHSDFNNIPTELGNHDLSNLLVLCHSCHAKLHNELSTVNGRFAGISSIEKGVHYILKGLKDEYGLNLRDVNFKDTPKRVARAYAEIFSGIKNTDEQVRDILCSAFPSEYNGMVIAKGVRVFSMCPHHLLPVDYDISVAYIPSPDGQVLGISKLSRLAEILAGRPVLQEQLGEDITKALMSLKGCKGAGCIIEGKHYCMMMRGVSQPNSKTGTSSLKGVFLDHSQAGIAARAELMSLWNRP